MAWMVVGPLWRHPQHALQGLPGTTLVEIGCLLGLAFIVARRAVTARLIVPGALYLPMLALIFYYSGVRLFVQMWHFSTVPVVAVIILLNFIPTTTRPRVAMWTACLLLPLCAYTLTNGYFYPQLTAIGSIDSLRAYRAEAPPTFTICSTDAGLMAYFNRHTVINLDGVVNNRAAKYIADGRLSDLHGAGSLRRRPRGSSAVQLLRSRADRFALTITTFRRAAVQPTAHLWPPTSASLR